MEIYSFHTRINMFLLWHFVHGSLEAFLEQIKTDQYCSTDNAGVIQ